LKTLGVILVAGPVGYLLLTAYLLGKIGPVPVSLLSSSVGDNHRTLNSLAA